MRISYQSKTRATSDERRATNTALLLALSLTFALPATGQQLGTGPQLNVELDVATFSGTNDQAEVELYLAFDAVNLPFRFSDSLYRASIPVQVMMQPEGGGAPVHTATTLDFAVPDMGVLQPGQQVLQTVRLEAEPGSYQMQAEVGGAETGSKGFERTLEVPSYTESDQPLLSDIIIASQIDNADGGNAALVRQGLRIQPNPALLFGQSLKQVYHYVEAYHLPTSATDTVFCTMFLARSNSSTPLVGFERRTPLTGQDQRAVVGVFDISTFKSGSYTLHVKLEDGQGSELAAQDKRVFIYNPNAQAAPAVAAATQSLDASLFMTMPEEELETLIRQMTLIATDSERRRIRRAKTLEEKRTVVINFWRRRDPEPRTPANEFKQEFELRLQQARERYSSRSKEGWETDRGRIVVKYGLPDNVERQLNNSETVPYVVWTYSNIEGVGQAFFIFADVLGFDTWELVHSDAPGELYSPNWQAEVRRR